MKNNYENKLINKNEEKWVNCKDKSEYVHRDLFC
jgi:hypothetical protein